MKIAASIYSTTQKPLTDIITELTQHEVDYFHVDCNDNKTVFNDIELINQQSPIGVDLHIISDTPESYFDEIKKHQISQVSFQFENFQKPILFPKDLNTKIGLAITSATPVDVFENYKTQCDFVLLMTTTPGKSGGTFDKNTFKKIRQFQKQYPDKAIQVDGGVNAEVSFILRNLGVGCAVVGSYLFSQNYIGTALLNLKKETVGSHFLLKDFMLMPDELPVINENEITFEKALQTIEDYKMAFTLVVNNQHKLTGLISNADVRKGLLKNITTLQHIPVADIINPTPLRINENKTIHDLLSFIYQLKFPLQYLPVTNDDGQLTGAILFTNLIKGEL